MSSEINHQMLEQQTKVALVNYISLLEQTLHSAYDGLAAARDENAKLQEKFDNYKASIDVLSKFESESLCTPSDPHEHELWVRVSDLEKLLKDRG